jgi:DNA mismatch repair protein MSH5
MEIEIIHDLAVKILEHEQVVIAASDLCGDLDSLVALAEGARRYNLVQPQMTLENVIHVTGGRHPLQGLVVPSYVPNDVYLRGGPGAEPPEDDVNERHQLRGSSVALPEGPSTLIMTGPNYSGKSVYLKQIALIVYMAHLGSYVPAESATIGLTDKILTRITTRETVSRSQSSFMIDLQQVAMAMRLATRRSLVIIDEFGKGTNSSDGAGLVCGVFSYFLGLGPERPKLIGATHFHEIFENGFLVEQPNLAFGHMEVRVDVEADTPEDQVTYLYNFVPGRSSASFGTTCAAMNGVDPAIVERAEQLVLLAVQGNDLVAACSVLSEDAQRDLQEAEMVARRFLDWDLPGDRDPKLRVMDVGKVLEKVLAM